MSGRMVVADRSPAQRPADRCHSRRGELAGVTRLAVDD